MSATTVEDEIREALEVLRPNYAEFGELAGLSEHTFREWQQGRKNPQPDSLRQFAAGLDAQSRRLSHQAEKIRNLLDE